MTGWVRAEEVLWRGTHEAVILLPPGTDEPFALGGTGVVLWQLLAEPATVETLAAKLAERFAAPVDRVRADLQNTIKALHRAGAVRCLD